MEANDNVKEMRKIENVRATDDNLEGERNLLETVEKDIAAIKVAVNQLAEKVMETTNNNRQSFILLKNHDARIGVIQDLVTENDWITEAGWEDRVDSVLGLRKLAETETFTDGDVIWVNFKAVENGEVKTEEEGFPVRFGAKGTIFEAALEGKSISSGTYDWTTTHNETEVTFTITATKAKRRVEDATGTDNTDSEASTES